MKHLARTFLLAISTCTWVVLSIGQDKVGSSTFNQDRTNGDVKIETKYDRSKNETTVSLEYMQLLDPSTNDLSLNVKAKYATNSPEKPPKDVTLIFISISLKGFKYPDVSLLTVVADGKHLPAKRAARLSKSIDGNIYVEAIATIMRYDDLVQIVRAKTVEMQLHQTQFQLRDQHLQKLRELARLLHAEGTPQEGRAVRLPLPDKTAGREHAEDVKQSRVSAATQAELREATQLHEQVAKLYSEGKAVR